MEAGYQTKERLMKCTVKILSVTATALFISALPAPHASGQMGQPGSPALRDECLIVAKADCPNHVDSINDRIARLNREIAKGTQTYSPEELKYLKKELDQFKAMHEYIDRNAPQGGY
jgi:hypothetical protein